MNLKLILILVLSSLAVMFVAQNIAPVEIGFLSWQTSMSTALLIFFALMAGFILGWFVHGYLLYRKSRNDKGELVYLR
ncbi:MAG: LapA family protein [Rhodocyclales bacterium]|nr:LapA family protein [Rhodocyclales bacterium]